MTWTAHVDGGSRGNPGPAGAGVSIADDKGREVFAAGFFLGRKTNNQAEYAGLLQALKVFQTAGAESIRILTDSELMAHQINGIYRVKSEDLIPLCKEARELLSGFGEWKVQYIPREQNRLADKLVNQALDKRQTVVVRDRLNLSDAGDPDLPEAASSLFKSTVEERPRAAVTRGDGAGGSRPAESGIEVVVVRSPRKGTCRAGMKQGQQFVFTETTPAGMCVEACAAVMEAVLAVRDAVADGVACDTTMSCRCPNPDCGAVFDIRHLG
jgi:uncharacterized repeat protein (TIGR04076 family)